MKIAHILISSVFVLFLIYAVHAYLTFELNLQEVKNAILLKNEAQANTIIQDLDKFVSERLDELKTISKQKNVQVELILSNLEFAAKGNTISSEKILSTTLSQQLADVIIDYEQHYGTDVIDEFSVTNRYGAVIAIAAGESNPIQNDNWWQIAKDRGIFVGEPEGLESYGKYSIPLAFRISNDQGDFLGVMRVLISIETLLDQFKDDVEVLQATRKNLILIDSNGRIIHSNEIKFEPLSEPVPYFNKIEKDNDHFEFTENTADSILISYSRSIGYGDFRGFGWIVVVEQTRSSLVSEFLEQENAILFMSILGMIASVIVGAIVSTSVSRPLQKLSEMAKRVSTGNFDVRLTRSRISEIAVMADSFNEMAISLKKLVETERDLAETRIKVKNERLTAIGQLAASMAHDLKNPLSTIRSSGEIINRTVRSDNGELDEVIARMNRAIDRMSHQIEDVLNFVRTTPLELQDISILSILQSSLKSVDVPPQIRVELPKEDFTVKADFRKLEVVFINLILNAIQAIGSNPGKILLRVKKENGELKIEIEDTGSGIPNEIFAKLFEPLVTTKEKGTGLGLSTCKNIIEQHGGTIIAKNNPTTFIVRLPEDVSK